MSTFGSCMSICGAVKETLELFKSGDFESAEACLKQIGYDWLKAERRSAALIGYISELKGLDESDWRFFIPLFQKADIEANETWDKEFPADADFDYE